MSNEKTNLINKITESLKGNPRLNLEKSRLEAFLDSVPGEYCGFPEGESPAYSEGFVETLELESISSVADIQSALEPVSATAVESMYARMSERGKPFTITVENTERTKVFNLSGARGYDLSGEIYYDVFWLFDVSESEFQKDLLRRQQEQTDQEFDSFKSAINSCQIPLWIRNSDCELTWCNVAYANLLDTSPELAVQAQKEIISTASQLVQGTKSYISSGDFRSVKDMAIYALNNSSSEYMQFHTVTSGKRKLLRIHETAVSGKNTVIGFARDLTREEDLEKTIERHTKSNRESLEHLRTAIAIYDSEQKLEFYNSAFSQLWGLADQWLNSSPKLGDIMEKLRETRKLPEQADFREFKKSWIDMFTGLIEPYEDMLHLPDGTALRMLAIANPMGGLMMTFEDVTSRLELESSYNTLIAVQKETLDNLAEGVAVYGPDGRIKLWNPTYAGMWNLHPEDLERSPHISILIEKRKSLIEEDKWHEIKDLCISLALERQQREGRIYLKDNTVLDYASVSLPDGGVLVSWSDVTDSVRVENILREKNAALETAEKLKTDFLANVSYQLRTPLNAIMGFTEILHNEYFGELNDKQKEYTANMFEAGEKLLSLINDILDLSSIEAGYMNLELREIDISEMLYEFYDLINDWTKKEQINLFIDCPEDLPVIQADERRIKQAILNLIRNSINYTPYDGIIRISAEHRQDQNEAVITISDTGIGISEENQKRIFEPFERIKTEQKQDGVVTRSGVGLGLSLVKNIIELHGGYVSMKSKEGEGTSISLHIKL